MLSRKEPRLGFIYRILDVALATVLFCGAFMWAWSAPAEGASKLKINWVVHASTHIKKLNETVVVPKGSFKGSVNLVNDHFSGNISLPPATSTIELLGVVPITATFQMKEAKPVTGTINLKTLHVKSQVSVNILITSATVASVPYNLVGTDCRTSQPVTLALSGKVHLKGTSTFKGTYSIPALTDCGVGTTVLNSLIVGPGNTFTASFAP